METCQFLAIPQSVVWCVVLNYGEADMSLNLCARISEYSGSTNLHCLLIDNGIVDDHLRQQVDNLEHCHYLATGANLGYAWGNNIGIKFALENGADWTVVLNNDITINPQEFERFIDCLVKMPINYVYCPRIMDLDGSTSYAGEYLSIMRGGPTPYTKSKTTSSGSVEVLSGAFFAVHKSACRFELLPTNYFLLWEDVDYSVSLRKSGISIQVLSEFTFYHPRSTTIGVRSPLYIRLSLRNRIVFWRRHFGFSIASAMWLRSCVIDAPWLVMKGIAEKRGGSVFIAVMKGLWAGLACIFRPSSENWIPRFAR